MSARDGAMTVHDVRRIELVTVGDELLLGAIVDTNGPYIARALGEIGLEVVRRTAVGDDEDAIAGAVSDALDRTGAVITTGGLGPTADDRTRHAIAAIFGRPLLRDEALAEGLRRWWTTRDIVGEMPAINYEQALVPEGARVLPNNHGSAPGILLEDDRRRWVAMLPGVPREMRGLLDDELLPLLRERYASGEAGTVIRTLTLRTTGIPESVLAERLEGLGRDELRADLAYLPGATGVDLRLVSRGQSAASADEILRRGAAMLRERAGRHVYGEGDTDLASVVLDACRARGWRVAVAESCTGGMLGARLTTPAGASEVLDGGVISYHDRVKHQLLGVGAETLRTVGAVSEEVARQMASGVRAALRTEVGIGITGIAGPGGGSASKPVGTVWIALDVPGAVTAMRHRFSGDRAEVRLRATQAALDALRLAAID